MKVRALVSFVARLGGVDSTTLSVPAGAEVELPAGADWLEAGLVEPVSDPAFEVATAAPDVERAVMARPGRRKAAGA